MNRYLVFSILLTGAFYSSNAQLLYMPRDIQQAYKNGTRSPDGQPGKKYWQNKARYNITISAAPPNHTMHLLLSHSKLPIH